MVPVCGQHLQVGAHDVRDAIDFRITPESIHVDATGAPSLTQRLQRHIDADLIAVFDAIGDGFFQTVDPDGYPIDEMFLHARREYVAGQSDDVQGNLRGSGMPGMLRERHPDLSGGLRGQFVVSECREQTQHAMRHTRAGFQQALMFAWLAIGKAVESPTDARQDSLPGKLRQVFGRQRPLRQIARAQDTRLPGQRDDVLAFTVFHDDQYIRKRR